MGHNPMGGPDRGVEGVGGAPREGTALSQEGTALSAAASSLGRNDSGVEMYGAAVG